jgi:hypothetical protein
VAAVGLDLQRDAVRREQLDNVPEVSYAERLAAAEGDVGNAAGRDAAGELERLAAGELVAPGAVRAGFLAAGDAARAAAIGELPGKKKGRAKLVNRASTARPRIGVNCRTVSGEADVGLGHDLLGDVLHPGRLPVQPLGQLDLFVARFVRGVLFHEVRFQVTHVPLRELDWRDFRIAEFHSDARCAPRWCMGWRELLLFSPSYL